MQVSKINFPKSFGYGLLICFAVTVVVSLYGRHQFLNNYKFTSGRVTKVTTPGYKSSGRYNVNYEYFINGKIYYNNTKRDDCPGLDLARLKVLLEGKRFPVAYSAHDVGASSIMMTQEDVDYFHYKFSDSSNTYDSLLHCLQ